MLASLALQGVLGLAHAADLRVYVNPTPGLIEFDASGNVIPSRSTAMLDELAHGAGLTFELKPATVARAGIEARKLASTCVSSMNRSSAEELGLSLIGTVTRTRLLVFTRADHAVSITSPGDLRGLRVAALQGSPTVQRLREQGVDVMGVAHLEVALRMLAARRLDYLATTEVALSAKELSALTKDVKPALSLGDAEFVMACHPEIRPELLERLRASLDGLRKRGLLRPYGVF